VNRIPVDKIGRRRYYRDRVLMQELEQVAETVLAVCNDSEPKRFVAYERAQALLAKAAAEFRKGWAL
jgi:hypothetical protein